MQSFGSSIAKINSAQEYPRPPPAPLYTLPKISSLKVLQKNIVTDFKYLSMKLFNKS